ncbi:MAG TPA: chloride channel protein [Anaeromyxobacteraceae bacterium]|nr:chloride channel protein [Anaeromyxobacteraceae bacterium]
MEPDVPSKPSCADARVPSSLSRGGALRNGLAVLWPAVAPLDLRILGRTLLQAALVGGLAGLLGAAFFAALEVAQRLLLEGLAGYAPAKAYGEHFLASREPGGLRLWALALLPAVGGLVSGLLTRLAPETAGGGGDAIIESYHRGAVIRSRILGVKALAAISTLSSGGSGGREGPTMQIGGAVGALVGRWLPTSQRERRILVVAGIAAGIAAVFRTPLGAALLATEMLYRDDFESDALVPAILASVIAYSVVISLFGESTLFGTLPRFPFVPGHLWLYGLLAIMVALVSVLFLRSLRGAQGLSSRLPLPVWARPGLGGLAMGLLGTGVVLLMAPHGSPHVGVFGGGYGVAQVALTGGAVLPGGWRLVALFLVICLAKLVASSLTIGSGAAAGDFAPSLVMGGLLGSAFGHAAALLLHDPRINPAAFALVGMGTFYGGVAHAPLSALVLVAELARSYDLLVPMMLAVSVAYVGLRHWTLYPAQPATKADSPAQRKEAAERGDRLFAQKSARDVLVPVEFPPVREGTTVREMVELAGEMSRQKVLLVLNARGAPRGLVDRAMLALVSAEDLGWANAHDTMVPFKFVRPSTSLAEIVALLRDSGLVQLPVMEGGGVLGYVGETELARAYAQAFAAEEGGKPPPHHHPEGCQ